MKQIKYWFRFVDDLDMLMSMKPAELRCYLVVARAIDKDRNAGEISITQVAKRARTSRKTAQKELASLVAKGYLLCDKRLGQTSVYRLPFCWRGINESPVRDQSQVGNTATGDSSPLGEHHQTTERDRDRTPTGDTHLEFSESAEAGVPTRQQHHHSSESKDDVALDVERVVSALRARACIGFAFNAPVRNAIQRKLEIVSAEQFQRAILLGCLRKVTADINRGDASVISSVEYFNNLIDEVQSPNFSPDYLRHIEYRLRQYEQKWVALRNVVAGTGRRCLHNERSPSCRKSKNHGGFD